MAQPGGIPTIYTDVSNPTHDFFTFRFTCEECHVFFDSRPKRSVVEVANRFADFGVKALDGFGLWQKAAETGEKVLDSDQEKEKATALLKAWLEVQDQFRFCQSCHRTVCARCFNESLRVCIGPKCAPDLQADSALYAYQKQREAQHQKIEQQYAGNIAPAAAPVPAITGSLPQQQYTPPAVATQAPVAPQPAVALAQICPTCARQATACPTCRKMGTPGKFCLDCGTRLPLTGSLCPRCHQSTEKGASFCAECGTRLS